MAVLVFRKGLTSAKISAIKYLGGSGVESLGESDGFNEWCGVVGIPKLGVDLELYDVNVAYDLDLD